VSARRERLALCRAGSAGVLVRSLALVVVAACASPALPAAAAQAGQAAQTPARTGADGGAALLQAPELPTQRGGVGAGMPWRDDGDGGHLERDAQRRAAERPLGPQRAGVTPATEVPQAPAGTPDGATPGSDDTRLRQERERGEREREARRLRGGMAPAPEPMPRIQPSAPPSLAMPPPPRIAIPAPGEPGGAPIALPTCGPAGCFDANGRPMGRSGSVLLTPEGRPCIQVGAAASC
jgi:hypothetical protein